MGHEQKSAKTFDSYLSAAPNGAMVTQMEFKTSAINFVDGRYFIEYFFRLQIADYIFFEYRLRACKA